MNIYNLKRMYNHILTVPGGLLSMEEWRKENKHLHECNTVGCIVGHCVKLDSFKDVPLWANGNIDFGHWSELFTDIVENSNEWNFMFSSYWQNLQEQTLKRKSLLG